MRMHSSANSIQRCGDRLLWFLAILLGGTLPVAAHVGVLPLSSQRAVLPLAAVQQIALSSIDAAAELATDTKAGNPLPLRFAVPQPVMLSPDKRRHLGATARGPALATAGRFQRRNRSELRFHPLLAAGGGNAST